MSENNYDVIVVGGGPAGMMAAGRAAELGAKVALIEKNPKLGKKLLITGGGRCNITNAEYDTRKLIAKYGQKGKALFGAFARFGVEDTIRFFEERGLKIKVEAEQRAFPVSDKAEDVWKVMQNYLKQNKVKIIIDSPVIEILHNDNLITGIKTIDQTLTAKSYIIATGGLSRPETGSTGDGFKWMGEMGHDVETADAALVPVKISDEWVAKLAGVSFANVRLTSYQDGKKQNSNVGKLLFTHFGISGPLVLNMSKALTELFKYAPVELVLDLYPTTDPGELDKKLLSIVNTALNKQIKNNLGELVPPKMIPIILELAHVAPDTEGNALTKEQRKQIVAVIKNLKMSVSGFLGTEKAIVTSGGVSLKEVDFKSMRSKLFGNLFMAGDILNFDRPSGGYSLQICWTTGYIAGENGTAN